MSKLQLRAVVADRRLDVEFSVSAGEVLAVLGPNGAGKSTALHVIAGLLRPDAGLVRLGDRVLTDTEAGVNVATHDRRVGLLLQDPLLFPHLSVAKNVAFGPQCRRGMFGSGRARTRASALRWLREVNAEQFADRKPRQLSGGQAQRVAIARALAAEPDVLLLDEPLTGLDVAAAAGIRSVLRSVVARSGCAVVLTTHDLLDVFTLADRVLVLESARSPRSARLPMCLPHLAVVSEPVSPESTWSMGPLVRTARCAPSPAPTGTAPRSRICLLGMRQSRCSRRRRWRCIRNRRTEARAISSG